MARDPRLEPVYTVFRQFLQRCLVEDHSLLWPEAEVWTIPALEQMRRRFVEVFLTGRLTFREKMESQLSGAPGEVWALAADCFYVYGLPTRTLRFDTKQGWVDWAARHAGMELPGPDSPIWEPLRDGFAVTGQKYHLKHAQLRLLTLLALEVKAARDRSGVVNSPLLLRDVLDGILEEIPLKIDRAYDLRNAILHMAFPEVYEAILSNRDKDAILQYYSRQASLPLAEDRDEALGQLRAALEPLLSNLGRPFDFNQDLREEWKPSTGLLERAMQEQVARARTLREPVTDWPVTEDPDVRKVLAALRLSKNVILYGPPGTGKTYIAHKVARSLVQPDAQPLENYAWWVTLHASYSYEDFVEGLRPVVSGRRRREESGPGDGVSAESREGSPATAGAGAVAYEVRPGVFREVCEKARRDPSHTYVLIIDEINRANLARILGELITLIEDDKRGILSARLPYSGIHLTVPSNLLLLGTMNTADRSIALLDAALRRRFAFVEIGPRPDLLEGAMVETEEAVLHLDKLLRALNDAIRRTLGVDHQIGHSYFLKVARAAPEDRLAVLELVWNNQVLPLLTEYFYTRRDLLAEILAPFADESQGDSFEAPDVATSARLSGEDLVVALSRI
jgi:MoxR-like ATPase